MLWACNSYGRGSPVYSARLHVWRFWFTSYVEENNSVMFWCWRERPTSLPYDDARHNISELTMTHAQLWATVLALNSVSEDTAGCRRRFSANSVPSCVHEMPRRAWDCWWCFKIPPSFLCSFVAFRNTFAFVFFQLQINVTLMKRDSGHSHLWMNIWILRCYVL
jgi:hypothetical protein